ncbi:MAG: hypothetical protein IPL99_04335 [Candidatus Competibacteraceae bacterium]|nr:hypothetical protein [Candidatus Competibacteraceae bacterium]
MVVSRRQAELRSAQARERSGGQSQTRQRLGRKGAITERALVEAKSAVGDAAGPAPLPLPLAGNRGRAAAGGNKPSAPTSPPLRLRRQSQAPLAVGRTALKPVSAVVQTRLVSQGDAVPDQRAPGVTLLPDQLEVFLALPEDLSGRILPGMRIELSARALPDWRQAVRPDTGWFRQRMQHPGGS